MKSGKTLTELAAELERQKTAKVDYVARAPSIVVTPHENAGLALSFGDVQGVPVRPTAHRQLGTFTGIPAKYYDRMKAEDPDLLAGNVNAWLARMQDDRRMIRTLDGGARAVLSDRYQRIDNADIAEAVLPTLLDTPGVRVASCEVTESRLYLKAVCETVQAEVKVNDVVEAGVLITNSEIGHGAVSITPMIHRLVCLNGMVVNDARYRRSHVGARADQTEGVYSMLSDEAIRADDRAILLKVRDMVRGSFDEVIFKRHVEKMREATETERMNNPNEAVERLSQKAGILESEKPSILKHLIEGADLTKYGAVNAITRAAQDVEDYDRSTELEQIGGAVLDLPASEWRALAEAA